VGIFSGNAVNTREWENFDFLTEIGVYFEILRDRLVVTVDH